MCAVGFWSFWRLIWCRRPPQVSPKCFIWRWRAIIIGTWRSLKSVMKGRKLRRIRWILIRLPRYYCFQVFWFVFDVVELIFLVICFWFSWICVVCYFFLSWFNSSWWLCCCSLYVLTNAWGCVSWLSWIKLTVYSCVNVWLIVCLDFVFFDLSRCYFSRQPIDIPHMRRKWSTYRTYISKYMNFSILNILRLFTNSLIHIFGFTFVNFFYIFVSLGHKVIFNF